MPRLLAPGVISTGDDESHAILAPDGRTLYFLKNTPNFDFWTIVTSRWTSGKWTTPQVAPFSGRWSDADPFLTEDGSKLYFISTRPVDGGTPKEDTDIWMVEKTAEGAWGEPRNLGAPLNSSASEWLPSVTQDGSLYFGSERPGGLGGSDIYCSRFVNGAYSAPENLGEPINSKAGEYEPMISPDGRFMIFAAIGRAGGQGLFDLWISYKTEGQWSKPENLGKAINSPGIDFAPRLSPDGKTLFFTSSRRMSRDADRARTYQELITSLRAPGNGLRDIYYVSTTALPSAPAAPPDSAAPAAK